MVIIIQDSPCGRKGVHTAIFVRQTCMGSNMPGLKYGSCRFGKSNSRSNVFQIRRSSVCVPSRWKVLSGEFRRRPTALAIKFRKSDRVGRRGLSEPREDFSRLTTYAIPWLYQYLYPWLESVCVPSCWKVLSGEFRRRPTALAIKFRKSARVGRRGLFEPGGIFSRLLTYAWAQIWFMQILAAD